MLYWLQPYFQWCDNHADVEFIVGVSKVYANSLLQKIGNKQNQSLHTHCISKNVQSYTVMSKNKKR